MPRMPSWRSGGAATMRSIDIVSGWRARGRTIWQPATRFTLTRHDGRGPHIGLVAASDDESPQSFPCRRNVNPDGSSPNLPVEARCEGRRLDPPVPGRLPLSDRERGGDFYGQARLRLTFRTRNRRQLQDGRVLSLAQGGKQHDPPVGKFERVMVNVRPVLVDPTEPR